MLSDGLIAACRKYAIKNAIDYGKADLATVMNKVIVMAKAEGAQVPELKRYLESLIDSVNAMDAGALKSAYREYEAEFESAMEEKRSKTAKPRMELEGAEDGRFATRFPPEPNGYLHIGHAKVLFLEDSFRKIYHGRLFLYFDDTNPKNEKQEYVDAIKEDLDWLGIGFDDEYYASDNIEKEYALCRKLIEEGGAYACTCNAEEMKKMRFDGIECRHRNNQVNENLEIFDKLVSGSYDGVNAVIRFKGDMKSENTVMRDPTIFRVVNEPHYRQGSKYLLWPTYFFNTPVMDSLKGVTDAIRSKEYELANELYDAVLNALHLRVPRMHLEARLNIYGNVTSKRKIVEFIKKGMLSGFDDPRLVTLAALRRRGITPEALRNFVLRTGMSKVDSTMKLSMLLDENKKVIDQNAKRLFFVSSPVTVVIDKSFGHVEIPLHPSNRGLGSRSYEVGKTVYISGEDAKSFSGKVVRLKGLGVVSLESTDSGMRAKAVDEPDERINTIQWVPEGDALECSIYVPHNPIDENGEFDKGSLEKIDGYIEGYAKNLDRHESVQLERFGFCAIDKKDPIEFIFMTK